MGWYKVAKYINNNCCVCEHCYGYLKESGLSINNHHIYNIGITYSCGCGKSKIWTNSIRGPEEFINFINGEEKIYYNGFCNDRYCGFCYGYLQPLKNGITIPGVHQRYDRWGCGKCKSNQNIAINGFDEWKENETQSLVEFYKRNGKKLNELV